MEIQYQYDRRMDPFQDSKVQDGESWSEYEGRDGRVETRG